mgnify:CR=1 FL=1
METNEKELTGYPSIDKPWLKYYSEEAINAPLPDCSMYEYLYDCNKDYLGNTALNYFGKKITYKKLFENIDKVAAALQANGVKKGDIVSVCTLTAPETIYLLYAINKVGAVSNWLGLTSPVQDLHNQLDSTDSKLVFVVEMAYDTIVEAAKDTKIEKIVSVPIEFSMPTAIKAAASLKNKHPVLNDISVRWKDFIESGTNTVFKPVVIDGNEMAVIIYTGGTTGIPKGVMLSSNAANAYPAQYRKADNMFFIKREHRFLCVLPPFIAVGLFSCINIALCIGTELIVYPDPKPESISDLFVKYKPNHFCGSPLHMNAIINDERVNGMDLSFLYSAVYGGEHASEIWEESVSNFLKKHGSRFGIINGYGMTETGGAVAITPHYINGLYLFVKNNIKIVDPDSFEELKYNNEGEVLISTPTMMIGYYNSTEATNEIISIQEKHKWLRTGDLGYVSENGSIKITGRIKRIYWRKYIDTVVRVYPMRTEEELIKSDNVERCTVVGKKDEIVGYRSIAFIILKDKSANTETVKSSLEKLSRDNLPESHIPDEYIFVDSFPLTRAGKVDYRALEKMAEEKGKFSMKQ